MPDPKKGSKISLTPHFDFFEVNHNRPFFGGSGIITEGSIMIAKLVILTYVVGSGIISWRGLLSSKMMLDPNIRRAPCTPFQTLSS